MTTINQNISLKKYNSFGIDVSSKLFCEYKQASDIKYLIDNNYLNNESNFLILGGGSNQLFTADYEGLIIHPINTNIDIIEETENDIYIKVGAGKDWDEFVEYTVNSGYGGIENLSNIPGNVGASPVQNIGAYGVEAKDTIYEVNIVGLFNGEIKTLSNHDCKFAYRYSIFKTEYKNKYLVDSVVFKLSKNPKFTTHYGSLQDELNKESEISLQSIRKVIIHIRDSKLPDPKKIGNGGSFFKNPVIPKTEAEILLKKYPEMVTYPAPNNHTKIAAGWLIEQSGLKGYINKKGTAGVHSKQALVLINKGNASGSDIVELAEFVQQTVSKKFGINLEPEVIILK